MSPGIFAGYERLEPEYKLAAIGCPGTFPQGDNRGELPGCADEVGVGGPVLLYGGITEEPGVVAVDFADKLFTLEKIKLVNSNN